MGAQANLNQEGMRIESANDSIVIRHYGAGIKGGRTLDMTDFPSGLKCIKAGHVVIRSTEDDTLYKPMPVASDGKSVPSDFHQGRNEDCTSRPRVHARLSCRNP